MMLDLGLIAKQARGWWWRRPPRPTRSIAPTRTTGQFEPVRAQPTLATAIQIGNPVSIHRAIAALQAFDGIVEQATEHELADASARADRTGMFNCPHTAVALAALEKLIARGEVQKTDRVIVVSTANGLKFSEFKTGYHTHTLSGITPRHANPPVELPDDYDAVRRAVDRLQRAGGQQVTWRALPPHAPPAAAQSRSKSGSSAAHRSPPPNRFEKAAALIARHQGPLVVVPSALAGITDLLLEGARACPRRAPRRDQPDCGDVPAPAPRSGARAAAGGADPPQAARRPSTRRPASTASSAPPSACSTISSRAPAIGSSRAASACPRRF